MAYILTADRKSLFSRLGEVTLSGDAITKCFLWTYVLSESFLSLTNLVRLSGGFNTAALIRVFYPISCLVIFPLFLNSIMKSKRAIKPAIPIFFLILTGVFVAAAHGNSAYFVLSDVVCLTIAMVLLATGPSLANLSPTLDKLATTVLIFEAVSAFAAYFAKFVMDSSFYLSVGSTTLFLPVAWYAAKGSLVSLALASVVAVLGLKVGVMVPVLIVAIYEISIRLLGRRWNLNIYAWLGLAAFALGVQGLLSGSNNDFTALGSVLGYIVSKLNAYNIFSIFFSGDDLLTRGGGRIAEIHFATKELVNRGWNSWIVGGGLGFEYALELSNGERQLTHNLHFTPMSLIARHGLFGLMLVCLPIYWGFRGFLLRRNDRISKFTCCYCLLVLGNSMTAFSIFTNPLFWLFLGAGFTRFQEGTNS